MDHLTVGLLSDTHVPYRMDRLPPEALEALTGVDLILHAGDVDDPPALDPLRALAPVHAVRGNVHLGDLSDGGAALPRTVRLELAGWRVLLIHGHQLGLLSLWLKGRDVVRDRLGRQDYGYFNRHAGRRLARRHPEADIIVFGHSHRSWAQRMEGVLLVNPGAVSPSPGERASVGRLHLRPGEAIVEIVALETGDVERFRFARLPDQVRAG
jgi:hypothetical protein